MNTSIGLITSCAILGLGLSGLAACDGEVMTEEDIQAAAEEGADETLPEDQQPVEDDAPAGNPEQEPEPDVIVGEAPMINVLSLTCLQPSDWDRMDEPMIVINGKQAWLGAGFVAGTTEEVRYESIAFESKVMMELWEVDVWDDYNDPNDLLGYVEVGVSAMGDGPQIATIETRGGGYELVYAVERCPGCSPGESPEEP
jgi:hypothetical protein